MEKLIVEEYLKEKGKGDKFIKLVIKMLDDNNINEEKSIEMLKTIYK